jgi:hypothetical protein
MIPAALSQAKSDRDLTPHAKVAYIFCLEYLSGDAWRKVKIEQVANAIGCEKMSAVRALRCLRTTSYIERRRAGRGEPCEYRLLPAPLLPRKARAA